MPGFIRTSGVVSIELSPPLEFIRQQLGAFKRELRDFTGLWRRFASVLEQTERERFATEGYGEWPPLSPVTVNEKARLGFPPFPMIRTGRLYESLTDREIAMRLTPQTMSWGTDVEYAEFHQEGRTWTTTSTHRGHAGPGIGQRAGAEVAATETTTHHLPQRKLLDIRVVDRRRLEQAMIQWIDEIAGRTLGVAR